MTTKATAADWAERVRCWRESGREAEAFAEENGYSGKLLRWWATELVRRERCKSGVKLARLVRAGPSGARLTVAVGAARIEVGAGFDRTLLRAVVDALGVAR
ncbi:MAG: IS66 family insertion sequence element accessory protein TnpA [Polyangiaceae bacterium]